VKVPVTTRNAGQIKKPKVNRAAALNENRYEDYDRATTNKKLPAMKSA